MNIYKFIISTIKKCKLYFVLSCILAITPLSLFTYSQVYYAKILSYLGENFRNSLSPTLITYLLIYGGILLIRDILNYLHTKIDTNVKIHYQMAMHNTLFAHNHKHSSSFFDTEQSGVILAKTHNLVSNTYQIFSSLRAFILPHLGAFIITFTLLFNISISLGATLIVLTTINLVISYYVYKKIKTYAKKTSNEGSKVIGILADSIANARLVKNTASLYHERKKLRHQINNFIRTKKQESHIAGISNTQNTLLILLFTTLNLSIIICFYYYQNLSLEHIILSTTLIIKLNDSIFTTTEIFDRLIIQKAQIDDALELLYRPFDITDIPNAKQLKVKENSITFKNISFQYNKDRPLFKNLNLEIKPNEKVGLVGLSGSGKSTLIKLILRSYNLNKGKITISNQDISKVTQFSLHQSISLISQEPCLFNRSIMDNLKFANKSATTEEIIKACKLAHIHDTIIKMPNGYDSIIGERGVKLSGGERQRISIAQAILKNTPILILDEATSALDSDSEKNIEKALKNIMKNKTVISIAHRLSTLKNMDKIIVLDNGKIIEQGTQKELIKNKDGTFYRLYKLQTEGYL